MLPQTINVPIEYKCDKCSFNIEFDQYKHFAYYFFSKIYCNNCKQIIDLYKIYLNLISRNFLLVDALACIGANNTTFVIKIKKHEEFCLEFSKFGIPENAKIFFVSYTPQGPIMPVECRFNNPTFYKSYGNKIQIYPKPIFEFYDKHKNETPDFNDEVEVCVVVAWIKNDIDDFSFMNLVEAFENYLLFNFEKAIIPANVAVESSLSAFIFNKLSNIVGNSRTEDFLQSAATYSYQLNVLLPVIANYEKFNAIPNEIRGKLNELRSLRNNIAHKGKLPSKITKEKCAELICSALFGYKYIQLISNKI